MSARTKPVSSICDACLLRTSRPLRTCRSTPSTPLQRKSNASSVAYTTNASARNFRDCRTTAPSIPFQPARSPFSGPNRSYSSTSAPDTTSSPDANTKFHPSESGFVRLTTRRLISLSGPDTQKFLQGLITADVIKSGDGRNSPFYCAFLDARGRVLWDVWIWPSISEALPSGPQTGPASKEGFWECYIDVDADEVDSLVAHLKRHRLRSRVAVSVPLGMSVWTGFRLNGVQRDVLAAASDTIPNTADTRFPEWLATRFLYRGIAPPGILTMLGRSELTGESPVMDEREYTVWRYLCGVPEGQKEVLRETALPMEYNIDLAGGIDWRKGCYVGQELTIRTKHTGVVRKRVLPVRLYREGGAVPSSMFIKEGVDLDFARSREAGQGEGEGERKEVSQLAIKAVVAEGERKGRPVGKLVARVGDVGLALCRLDVMTPFKGAGDAGVESGFKEGQEFEVVDEGGVLDGVRVKAFLPEWLVEREREVWGKKGRKVEEGEEVE